MKQMEFIQMFSMKISWGSTGFCSFCFNDTTKRKKRYLEPILSRSSHLRRSLFDCLHWFKGFIYDDKWSVENDVKRTTEIFVSSLRIPFGKEKSFPVIFIWSSIRLSSFIWKKIVRCWITHTFTHNRKQNVFFVVLVKRRKKKWRKNFCTKIFLLVFVKLKVRSKQFDLDVNLFSLLVEDYFHSNWELKVPNVFDRPLTNVHFDKDLFSLKIFSIVTKFVSFEVDEKSFHEPKWKFDRLKKTIRRNFTSLFKKQ